MKYKLLNILTNKIEKWDLSEIIAEISRDRSAEWTNYNKDDWQEGLEVFTEYRVVK